MPGNAIQPTTVIHKRIQAGLRQVFEEVDLDKEICLLARR